MSQTKKQKVEAAIKSITEFYAIGTQIPQQSRKGTYSQDVIGAEAVKLGMSPDTTRKARQFANCYTEDELRELCGHIRAEQTKQDNTQAVFGRSHLLRMLSVEKRWRSSLQKTAIRNGWSVGELETQIAARFGSRRDGGRKRRVPGDVMGLLAQIERQCESWSRWKAAITPATETTTRRISVKALPTKIQKQVGAVAECMAALHRTVIEELKAHNRDHSLRMQFRDETQK